MAALRKTRQRTWVAWLGLFAMWLTVGMPVVSQFLPGHVGTMDMGGWCTPHGLSNHHPQGPSEPSSPLDKCGYCSLFCHSPLALGDASLALPPRLLPAPARFEQILPASPLARLLSARPRGPPSLA
jgi:hypothetical protein